jgi:hypothetical protein
VVWSLSTRQTCPIKTCLTVVLDRTGETLLRAVSALGSSERMPIASKIASISYGGEKFKIRQAVERGVLVMESESVKRQMVGI